MAFANTISIDLLPAVKLADAEQRDSGTIAHSLPHVVWDRIVHYISDHPATLFTIATFSRDLRDICRPHISKRYEKLPTGERFLYHRVLQLVLQGYVDPSYIYEVECEDAKLFRGLVRRGMERPEDLEYKYDAASPGNPAEQKQHVSRLLREAVTASPWIPQAKEDELCEHFHNGDPDVALAVLLPLCTKLKTLEIPKHANHCATVMQAVAQAYCRRGITGAEARRSAWEAALRDRAAPAIRRRPLIDALPFCELLILFTQDRHWEGFSLPLVDITAFVGIPSLHRVVLDGVHDQNFPAWPTEHVECSCPEIWLQRSSCTPRAVLAFAQGLADSCGIRQQYDQIGEWVQEPQDAQLTGDSVLVLPRDDGSKDIETRIAFDGGDPGHEHAWVSWMYWGKMKDWRRLDEEFSVQEGDNKVIELGSGI